MNFFQPNAELLTNAIVVVGNLEFHISKEFLASHSAYFQEKFFKNPEDLLQDRFIIDSFIDSPKFQKLLEHLYHEIDLDEHNVSRILEAAAFFKVQNVLKNAMDFLISMPSTKFWVVEKLFIADKLGVPDLLEIVLDQYFALEKIPFLEISLEPIRTATAYRMMERAIEQQKSLGIAPELKEELRERLLKAEEQGPEAVMQEKAIQLILEAANSQNPHIPIIRRLCGLDPASRARRMPTEDVEERMYNLLREAFPIPPEMGYTFEVPPGHVLGSRYEEEALENRLIMLGLLRDAVRRAGGPGRVLDGLDIQDWEAVFRHRLFELKCQITDLGDLEREDQRQDAPEEPPREDGWGLNAGQNAQAARQAPGAPAPRNPRRGGPSSAQNAPEPPREDGWGQIAAQNARAARQAPGAPALRDPRRGGPSSAQNAPEPPRENDWDLIAARRGPQGSSSSQNAQAAPQGFGASFPRDPRRGESSSSQNRGQWRAPTAPRAPAPRNPQRGRSSAAQNAPRASAPAFAPWNSRRGESSSAQNAPEAFPVETRWIRRTPNASGASSSAQNAPGASSPQRGASSSSQVAPEVPALLDASSSSSSERYSDED